ncbi:uncharacterized protein LOC123218573 isoform X2 [Mangifera indica]|uniref:uncharacterized protein LOC123218573 isoform X2 n=1 Tax=Mangifera indica TaxID=29780 RepID=UPI001CFB792D|nr:uncharacterized protein LOC123218573 isoform X2 [Mangifera indica]
MPNSVLNTACSVSSPLLRLRASYDTQQRLSYNPNAPRKLKSNNANANSDTTKPSTPTVTITTRKDVSVSDLLKRPVQGGAAKLDESYLGYEVWLPNPPKVEKPRSVYNAASLAYIGDCIYELYARRHFLFPPLSIEEYNDRVMAVVCCEAQGCSSLGKEYHLSQNTDQKKSRYSSLQQSIFARNTSWLSVPDKCESLGRSHGKAGILNWLFYTANLRGTKQMTS